MLKAIPAKMKTDPRFRVVVEYGRHGPSSVEISDLRRRRRFARWEGNLADRILMSDAFPAAHRRSGVFRCDKDSVQQLMLAAAATCMPAVDQEARLVDLNRRRLRRDRNGRSSLHNRILDILFSYPGQHFSEQDILCIMTLQFPCIGTRRVSGCLRDFVLWRLVQRIEVDEHNVFYDINTTPHLHVYDPDRRLLLDAPESGVVTARISA